MDRASLSEHRHRRGAGRGAARGAGRSAGRGAGRSAGRGAGRGAGRSAGRGAAHGGEAAGGEREWDESETPSVGVQYPDYVLKASEGAREPINFYTMATVGQVSRYSSIMPWQVRPFTDIVRAELGRAGHKTMVDVTAHIGGEGIVLAKTLKLSGTMIEIDAETLVCLRHNIDSQRLGGPMQMLDGTAGPRFRALEGDGAQYILDMPRRAAAGAAIEDVVYADPPWGGPGYVNSDRVVLSLGGKSVPQLVRAALGAGVKVFVLKAPKNVNTVSFDTIDGVSWRKHIVYVDGTFGPRPSFVLCFFAADAPRAH